METGTLARNLPPLWILAMVVAVAAMVALSGPALAAHDHYLVTPGTCVEDVARGQTEKGPGEGGYHKFHDKVHFGTAGTFALGTAGSEPGKAPVGVYREGTGPGCPSG